MCLLLPEGSGMSLLTIFNKTFRSKYLSPSTL